MEITWRPDKVSEITLHDQIVSYFRERISSGDWPVGTRLPAERRLSEQMDVNRSTVSHVMDELKSHGIIESHGSKGTYVANNTWSLMNQPNWHQHIKSSLYMPNHKIIQKINHYEFQEGIIRLGTGELSPELFPRDLMQKMLIKAATEVNSLNYEEGLGQYELRSLICKYLVNHGIKAVPDQVLITSGSLQSLHLLSIGLLQRGSTVYIEAPSYLKSLYTFQSAGMLLQGIGMTDEGLDVQMLRRIFKKRETNLLYTIPTFHNPTGIMSSDENRKALMEVVEDRQIPVIEDDAYRELWLDTPPPLPLKSRDNNGNVIYIGTLSKTFAPGIRLGWVVGPQPVVERLGDIKMQIDYGTSSLSQIVAKEWFREGHFEVYRSTLRESLLSRRTILIGSINRFMSSFGTYNVPGGGFYVWFTFYEKVDTQKLFEEALAANVLLNVGSIYDFRDNNSIRLSYAYASEKDLVGGIERLARIIPKCIMN